MLTIFGNILVSLTLEGIQGLEEKPERDQNKMIHLDILNQVKVNVLPESVLSTLKAIIDGPKSDLSFSKKELRNVQAKLKQAFVEFHRKLRLLKNYS